MAITCSITDGTNTIDFTSTSSFQLAQREYTPKIATPPGDNSIPEYITEVLPCRVNEASDDALATELQKMAAFQKLATLYWEDPTEDTPVWFQMKLDSETGARRALVKNINVVPTSSWFQDATGTDRWIECDVVILRHPYWERTSTVTLATSSGMTGASIVYDPTSAVDIVGDVPGRIEKLVLSWAAADPLDRFWMGLRSANKHGTLANFAPIWECEDGTNVTDAADAVDGTASDGNKVTVTPGTATWAKRMHILLSDVTANYTDNYGRFVWLLRAKVSAGTWEVYMRYGHDSMPDDEYVRNDVVKITNTSWYYFNLGQMMIPLHGAQLPEEGGASHQDIQLWARRTVGAGTLDMDCICPFPIDEGYCVVSNGDTGTTGNLYFKASPKDEEFVNSMSTYARKMCPFESNTFRLPVGDMRLIFIVTRDTSSDLTDVLNVSTGPTYYPRWTSLRGSE